MFDFWSEKYLSKLFGQILGNGYIYKPGCVVRMVVDSLLPHKKSYDDSLSRNSTYAWTMPKAGQMTIGKTHPV